MRGWQVRKGFLEEMRIQLRDKRGTGVKRMKVKGETFQRKQFVQKSHNDGQRKLFYYR